jgi:hypothetical protein
MIRIPQKKFRVNLGILQGNQIDDATDRGTARKEARIYRSVRVLSHITGTRFHDRFYLARHRDGSVWGMFGPSMSGLNDKSFVLVGELEEMTRRRLRGCLDGWAQVG